MLLFETMLSEPDRTEKAIHIYRNYYSYMIYIAGRYLTAPADREDAVQDCMVKLISVIDSIDISDEARLKGLCGVVTRNIVLNMCRRKENGNISLDEIFNVADREEREPEDRVIEKDTLGRLVGCIESLGETYRDVLKLKFFNQLKEHEIAKLLDLPPKTVNQRIFRGKQLLRRAIEEEERNG